MTKPDRIIVCSDGAAQDELRKTMIIQAAPPGVHVHVVLLRRLLRLLTTLVLAIPRQCFCLRLLKICFVIEGGVEIQGSKPWFYGSFCWQVVVTNAVAMDVGTM